MFYKKSQLGNGITVITEAMENVRSVALGFWVKVGSRDEPPEVAGISHFVEHMMFKGTKTRTAHEISSAFEGLGAEINAFTGKEYTCYYSRFLDEHLPVAFEIHADMLKNSLFKREHVLSEREVVLEEIHRHEDSPDEMVHDVFAGALFDGHPLGRQILGERGTVEKFGSRTVRGFVGSRYVPETMVVAAAGNVSHEAVVELVEEHFGSESGEQAQPRSMTEPPVKQELAVVAQDTEQAHICMGTRGLKVRDDRRFALGILDSILGGGMSSRLFQEIREKRGLAYSVYSYHSYFVETGSFSVYVGTRPANAAEVVRLVVQELAKLAAEGVTEEELNRAKEYIKGHLVLGLESTRNRMTRIGKAEAGYGELLSLDELVARVDAVTGEDVKAVAAMLFAEQPLVVAGVGPLEEDVLASALKEVVA